MRWVAVALGLLFGGMLYHLYRHPLGVMPGWAQGPPAAPPPEMAARARPAWRSRPLDAYRAVTAKPLFYPDRRLPETIDSPGAPAAESDAADFDLVAVILTPDGREAWVRTDPKRPLRRLRRGDRIQGWTVRAVAPQALEIERGAERKRIPLLNYPRGSPP